MADLKVDLGFGTLKNPVITASGTFGYGEEFLPFFDLDILGAIVTKGIFKEPRPGNPPPRLQETPAGLLNSIGLAGPGSSALQEIIRRLHAKTSAARTTTNSPRWPRSFRPWTRWPCSS
jgi:dihydroorotate dehydrogenase (NAD+) catalytic subunit